MGLYHNTVDMGIMNTTDVIAASAVPPIQFPNNIQWLHAPDDQKRLRHFPDIWVRPGGIPFGLSYSTTPISPDDMVEDAEGITLNLSPVVESVPIGALVRVNFELANIAEQPLPTPASLSLKTGFVRGVVVDPLGTARAFLPLVLCIEEHDLMMLEPEGKIKHSVTLLRRPQGALFPVAGPYQISIEVQWEVGEISMRVVGETQVIETPAENKAHAEAAFKILSTPDAVLTLALGGDHLPEGTAAIQTALHDKVLRPHYTVVEAKRIGKQFGKRKANPKGAAELLDEATVLSHAEAKRVAELFKGSDDGARDAKKHLVKILKDKSKGTDASGNFDELLEAL